MKYAELFDEQIKLLEKQIRSSKIKGNSLLIGGAALMVYAARHIDTVEVLKLAMGFLTSGVSVVLFRDVSQRQERVISYTYMKSACEASEGLPKEEQQKLEELAMDALRDMLKR
jgi:hypothetical protein